MRENNKVSTFGNYILLCILGALKLLYKMIHLNYKPTQFINMSWAGAFLEPSPLLTSGPGNWKLLWKLAQEKGKHKPRY